MTEESHQRTERARILLVGRIRRFVWPVEEDALLQAARVALGVAAVALLYVALSMLGELTAAQNGDRRAAAPRVGAKAPARSTGGGATAQPTKAGYEHWDVPGRQRLLMVPAVGRNGQVWVGELAGRTLAAHAPNGSDPAVYNVPAEEQARTGGAAVDGLGAVWLAQDGSGAIARYDPETQRYTAYLTPTPNPAPFGIAIDAGNRVWFTEMAAHRIGLLDPATEVFTEYPLPDGVWTPYWLAVAPDGRVWFTTLMSPTVGVLEPRSGNLTVLRVPGLREFDGTTGIDVAPDGSVWFGTREGKLGRVDPQSLGITTHQTPGDKVYGVAADQLGTIWAASTQDEVFAFRPTSGQFCTIATGEGSWWLVDAPDGSIWVSESVTGASGLGWISPERAAAPCAGGAQ